MPLCPAFHSIIAMKYSISSRYSSVTQIFHWLTAVLVLAAFVLGPGGSELRVYLPARDFERQIHETLGLCVLALTLLRLLWRLLDKQPTPSEMPAWMHLLSKAAHGGLYLLLLAVPVSAVIGAWLQGHPLTLLAGFEIAPKLAMSHDLGNTIAEVHGLLGDLILWLAGLHAVAAIYHHVFLRDGVLVSMLPRWVQPLRS